MTKDIKEKEAIWQFTIQVLGTSTIHHTYIEVVDKEEATKLMDELSAMLGKNMHITHGTRDNLEAGYGQLNMKNVVGWGVSKSERYTREYYDTIRPASNEEVLRSAAAANAGSPLVNPTDK